MELREKIKRAMTAEFIGDVPFDDTELDEMKRDCQRFYRQVQGTWSKIFQKEDIEELIVLIVNISKSWGDDKESRFWVKQFGEIFDDATISPSKFYDEFESVLARNNKKLFLSKEGKRMFREVFLLHAFAPDQSSDSFIRLLWNWFVDEDVVNYDYQQNDSLYQKIADFLSAKFSGETNLDEDSSFEGKTYAIRSSFKYLFTQDPEKGVWLLNKLFGDFNDIYFNGRYDQESFYGERCAEIVNNILSEANEPVKRRRRAPTEHIVSDYKKIYAAYEIDPEGKPSIFLPEIRAIDESAEEYDLEIYNDEELVYRGSGYIVGSDLKRRIKRISIPFDTFAHKAKGTFRFRIKLFVERPDGDTLLYDSHSSLYREFILFKTGRETRQTTCKPDTYYVVHPYTIALDARMTTCAVRSISAYVSTIMAQDGDYLLGQTQQAFFSNRPKDSHVIMDGKESGLVYKKDGQSYPHYKKVKTLTVLLDPTVAPQSIAVISEGKDKAYPLSTCSQSDGNKYMIDLGQIEGTEEGAHTLYITDVSKQKRLHRIDYFVDRYLSVCVSRTYAFDKDAPHLSITGISEGDGPAEIVDLYKGNIVCGCEKVEVDYFDGIVEYPIPYIKWSIDDNEWHYGTLATDLWKGDDLLHNNCVLDIDNASGCDLALYINKTEIPLSSGGKYLLGDALTENAHNAQNEITLFIGSASYKLFTVYNAPYLNDDFDIDLDRSIIDFSSSFCGDPMSRFHVVLSGEFHSYDFTCGVFSTFETVIEDGEYNVKIYLLDFFGEDSTLLIDDDFILGNPDKICFLHKEITLTKFKNPKGGKIALSRTYISDIRYLRDESETAVYSGTLNCQRNRYEVEIYKKSDDNLKFYFVDGESLLPVYYDMKQNAFTKKENADTILCSSCYYTKEDF